MTQERLTLYPTRNDIDSAADMFNNTSKIQNNFDDLVNNLITVTGNNNFSGNNTFAHLEAMLSNTGFKSDTISATPANDLTFVYPLLLLNTTAGAIAGTLPKLTAGNVGKFLILNCSTFGSGNNAVISCNTGDTLNATGNNTITMNAVDDNIILLAISTTRWLILVNTSCSLSTV